MFENNNFKSIICIDACNFNKKIIPKNSKNVFIFVSQSGETKDLYEVLTKVNGLKIGVINVVDSLIARNVDCGVYLNVGKEMSVVSTKVFMAQSLVLCMIAMYISNDSYKIERYIKDLRQLENLIEEELNKDITLQLI